MRAAWRRLRAGVRRPSVRAAFLLAVASDAFSFGLLALGWGLGEPAQIGVDLATALGLGALLRPGLRLAVPLALEAVPGTAVFPLWTLAVAWWIAAGPEPAP